MKRTLLSLWLGTLALCPVARAAETPPAEAPADAGPVVTKPPKLVRFVEAVYPKDRHDAGITASVLLSIEIADDGKVGEVEIVQGAAPDFDAAAVAAAKQFVFEPAEIDHQPAPVKITYKYDFTIVEKLVKAGPQINFDGLVLERFKKRPMPRVVVTIEDLGADVKGVTDEDGHFAFTDVPPGKHKVELAHPKLVTVTTEEEIVVGKRRTVKYLVEEREEGVDEEVVVRAPRIKKEAVETRIRTEEARRVPGTQGDTLKVVQNLPGVGRSAFGSGQLIVWGSAPKETVVNVDGVEIPALYHVGGLRSTINSDLVRSIDLSPGSYGAEYGRGLGGLVKIELGPLQREGVHGYVAADVIDTSAMVSAALTPQLRLALAGRISYLDRVLQGVTAKDVGEFVPIPRYDDYQARATLSLRHDEELAATFLASDDHLHRSIPAADPAQDRGQNSDSSYKRLIVRYSRLLPDGSSVVVTPSFGRDTSSSDLVFGNGATAQHIGVNVDTWHTGVRGAYRRKLAASTTLSFGLDLQARAYSAHRVGSQNLPSREGDIVVFGQLPPKEIGVDDWGVTLTDAAPFVTGEIVAGRLTLLPGLRFDPVLIEGTRSLPRSEDSAPRGYERFELPDNPVPGGKKWTALRWAPNPRLVATFRATKRFSLTAGGGIYGQPPDVEDMSPVFGNPTIDVSRALHASGGASFKLRPTLTFEVVGFYKKLYDLVSRSESPSPSVAQSLTQDGIGRSYGAQALLRQELTKGFFGWVTYSLIRSERRDHADQAWRLFDYDQTHVLAVLASYQFGHGWEGGARFRYTTGAPRTPVVGSFLVGSDEYDPIFGVHNSVRLPSFYQVDARLERSWVLRRAKLNLFLDVQNLTNRKNPEEIIYNPQFTVKGYITGLPTLAVLGARVEF
ncbi:MAG: TonB family protein / TonB-dependent receptor [Myxococcales bacterium]|nr:TonB family protein / TonB-dependent receptor [Myxococcales bacterium]